MYTLDTDLSFIEIVDKVTGEKLNFLDYLKGVGEREGGYRIDNGTENIISNWLRDCCPWIFGLVRTHYYPWNKYWEEGERLNKALIIGRSVVTESNVHTVKDFIEMINKIIEPL